MIVAIAKALSMMIRCGPRPAADIGDVQFVTVCRAIRGTVMIGFKYEGRPHPVSRQISPPT
jgi:hypothetical protein